MSSVSSQLIETKQIASTDIFQTPMTREELLCFRMTQFSMNICIDSLHEAITRVNGCWERIKGYSGNKEHITDDMAIIAVVKGICRGSVEVLLDYCAKGLSIEESAQLASLDKKDVYFRHLFPGINILDLIEKNYKEKQEELKCKIDIEKSLICILNGEINKKRSEVNQESEEAEITNKMQLLNMLIDCKENEECLRIDEKKIERITSKLTGTQDLIQEFKKVGIQYYNSHSIERKAKCKSFDSLSEYGKTLDSLLSNLSPDVIARGIIELPQHTMGFEHGPKGFFIFDTFQDAGLYQFPDKDTFVKALQSFALRACLNRATPDFVYLTEELKKTEVLFTVTSLIF